MPRYFALLRGINAGGIRTIKMETLRAAFRAMGLTSVETLIASGNVIFETPETDTESLETRIEIGLFETLGYEVATLLRTWDALADIARFQPFTPSQMDGAAEFLVIFIRAPLDETKAHDLMSAQSYTNTFHIRGAHVYWLRRLRPGKNDLVSAPIDRVLGSSITTRSINTVRKLVEKYG